MVGWSIGTTLLFCVAGPWYCNVGAIVGWSIGPTRLTTLVAPLATFTWMIFVDGGRGIFLLRALSPNRISNSLNPTGFRGIVR